MNVAIRITQTYEELRSFFDQVRTVSSACAVYQHSASRDHVHAIIKDCKVSTDTLKNYVKRALGVTTYPKSDWSFKTIHEGGSIDDNFITYMSKGTLEPVYQFGYQPSDLDMLKSKWIPIVKTRKSEMVQYKIKVENPRESKIRQNELMDMVKRRCQESNAKRGRPVLEIIRQVVYVEHRTIVGRYKLRDFYDYVVSDTDKESWLDNMEKIISFKDI